MHNLALGRTSLTALLITSSFENSTKSLTTSWNSPWSWGLTLLISWSQMPQEVVTRASSGLRAGHAISVLPEMSKQWTTSPGSKDWHTNCKMQNSVLRPRWWVAESAAKCFKGRFMKVFVSSSWLGHPVFDFILCCGKVAKIKFMNQRLTFLEAYYHEIKVLARSQLHNNTQHVTFLSLKLVFREHSCGLWGGTATVSIWLARDLLQVYTCAQFRNFNPKARCRYCFIYISTVVYR